MVFLYPLLSKWDFFFIRLLGGGLGNLLLPWARSVSLGNKYDLPVIYPTWPQIKVGTYLRRESDKRLYFGIFAPTKDYIVGWGKFIHLLRSPWIGEAEFLAQPEAYIRAKKNYVVIIAGYKDFFSPILNDFELIKKSLLDIVRPCHTPLASATPYVAVHIRLGDFKVGGQTTPLEFFDKMLSQIKANLAGLDVLVFTDGRKEEIDCLLSKHEARLAYFGSSVADILAMSYARLLVASKNSTFSWWASYLGRMPVIWPRDTSTYPIYGNQQIELYLDKDATLGQELFSAVRCGCEVSDGKS
jgi:hypothetical protein